MMCITNGDIIKQDAESLVGQVAELVRLIADYNKHLAVLVPIRRVVISNNFKRVSVYVVKNSDSFKIKIMLARKIPCHLLEK